ncbi:MAG: RNA polymerase sporulation sigma factor SigH [Oscillospiraceae bacterium]|nr:RNA polymerase sporulation sigma factor SigH [Oscillospiraceae bacterium]
MADYENLTDDALIRRLRGGDTRVMDYLMDKYKYLVRRKANTLFLLGGDTEDLIQEGMIGLFKAIRDYEEDAGSFYRFAELCVNRQIYSAIEAAARKKHGPLNSYISLSGGEDETEGTFLEDAAAANNQNPEQILIDRESVEDVLTRLREHLSPMEQIVLGYHLDGMNYHRIAEQMGKSEKSIDNALQRIRKKTQALLAKRN